MTTTPRDPEVEPAARVILDAVAAHPDVDELRPLAAVAAALDVDPVRLAARSRRRLSVTTRVVES